MPLNSVQLEYKPLILNLKSNKGDKVLFNKLINDNTVTVFDEIQSQIYELLKNRNVSVAKEPEKIKKLYISYIENINLETYGAWVYYPWNKTLIHILEENDFVFLRTVRNRDKILEKEQCLLSNKTIGIVGMSVGQTIAMSLATERTCNNFVLADFDDLEVSNLNRLSVPLSYLGLNKAVITARRIAEIDPYLNVNCITEAINSDNVYEFFHSFGLIDLVIDECDNLITKLLLRKEAKKNKIPLLMDSSDRGMLDVERYDIDESLNYFFGLINETDLNDLINKGEYHTIVKRIINFTDTSHRFKKSYDEIGKSLLSWPQLASSIYLGAGATTTACREILLNKNVQTGRYYIDVEQILMKSKID